MTQRDIERAVARATGETVGRVHQIGFTLVVVPPPPLPRRRPARDDRSSLSVAEIGRPSVDRYAAHA